MGNGSTALKNVKFHVLKAHAVKKLEIRTNELKDDKGVGENVVEKVEKDGYQHFLLFPRCFQKLFLCDTQVE